MPLSDSKSCVLVSIYKNDSLLWLKKSLSSIDLNIIDKVFIGIDGLIKSLLKSGKLIIVGSPTRSSLGPFHNTQKQIDDLKN